MRERMCVYVSGNMHVDGHASGNTHTRGAVCMPSAHVAAQFPLGLPWQAALQSAPHHQLLQLQAREHQTGHQRDSAPVPWEAYVCSR